jgi:effector-binding domain-containing protein
MSRQFGAPIAGAALVLSMLIAAQAQPAPPAAPANPPAEQPAPATPAPAAPATPAPDAAAPATPPAAAPGNPADPFGEEVEMPEKTIIYFKGTGNWDAAFDTIIDGFKTLKAYMDKQDIQPSGPATVIYTATDDASFSFQAAFPIDTPPKDMPKGDITVGKAPTGKALHFVHRGSYDSMDTTYEAITNYLDEKNLDAKDLFIERYQTNPLTTSEDKLVIDVLVPVK